MTDQTRAAPTRPEPTNQPDRRAELHLRPSAERQPPRPEQAASISAAIARRVRQRRYTL